MSSHLIRHPGAAALYGAAEWLHAGARGLKAAARKLDAWLLTRQAAARARYELCTMSDRELRDIGLDRADVTHVARGGSPRWGA